MIWLKKRQDTGYNSAFFDAMEKIRESMDTPEALWLRNLPTFICPTCGKKTIFKSGCGECDDKGEAK